MHTLLLDIVLCAHQLKAHFVMQVLGRNLEALVTRAQEIKADWKDEFVSVEHMLLAFLDDAKFGTNLLKGASLDKAKIEAAVKEIRGSNRVTDQVLNDKLATKSLRHQHDFASRDTSEMIGRH